MDVTSQILVTGARGLVGGAIRRRLESDGFRHVLAPGRDELDLADRRAVDAWFARQRPEYVFMAAAKVGGILANATYPADFIRENLEIALNVIDASWRHGVRKFMFLGSSCIYPKFAEQPMTEGCLMTGPLEPTNSGYALAKIAGIEMVKAYRRQHGFSGISVIPPNLYGPNDNYDLKSSHVVAALIRRFHEAKLSGQPTVEIWGTGNARREFMHVDDLADALVHLMRVYDDEEIINVGVGDDLTIAETARLIAKVVGFTGEIRFDASKPDGMPRKVLDVSRLKAAGWRSRIPFEAGVRSTYQAYLAGEARFVPAANPSTTKAVN